MRRQNHAVLDNHVGRLDPRIEQQRVLRGIGNIGRVAPKDSSVVRLGAVRIADPVEFSIDEVQPAAFVPRVHGIRHDGLPLPRVLAGVINTSQPVALASLRPVGVARAGIERIFGRVIRHIVNVAAKDPVVRIAQRRTSRASAVGAVVSIVGILAEGIRDLHGLPVVGRVVDVHRRRAANHVAIVPPDQHLRTVDIKRVDAREAVKVPAGQVTVSRCMLDVIRSVCILDRNLLVRFQVVRAEVQFCQRAEEDVAVLENAAKHDMTSVGKPNAMRPGAAVVFGQQHFPVRITERLIVALRVDKQTVRLWAIPEVIRRGELGRGNEVLGATPDRAPAQHPAGSRRRGTQEPAASNSFLRYHTMPFVITRHSELSS